MFVKRGEYLSEILVEFQGLPSIYSHCKAFGHETVKCKSNQIEGEQQEWVFMGKGKGDMPQTNVSSPTGPKSPIKNLQEVGLCGDTNRFTSLLEEPVTNEEFNEEIPAIPFSASQSDVVQSEIAATSTSTGTLDHPTNVVFPNQIVIAGHMDDIPASEHIEISVEKGVVEAPGPPQTAPVQPMPLPSNKKSGRGKKNKR
ncbi:hypothetical protein U1Q18_000887, partial [Sarracenia purpurea var. burkii]